MIKGVDITTLILCGGKGARLGGQDKPLLSLGSDKIIDHLLTHLEPQTGEIVISCSRNVARYEAYELRIVVDESPDEGPLGGLQSAFKAIDTEWALTCPGDTPFLTRELVTRLSDDAERQGSRYRSPTMSVRTCVCSSTGNVAMTSLNSTNKVVVQ